MTQRTLTDPGMGNMPSHTVLAPKDWTVKGGGWWPGQNFFKHVAEPGHHRHRARRPGRPRHAGLEPPADYRPERRDGAA